LPLSRREEEAKDDLQEHRKEQAGRPWYPWQAQSWKSDTLIKQWKVTGCEFKAESNYLVERPSPNNPFDSRALARAVSLPVNVSIESLEALVNKLGTQVRLLFLNSLFIR